MFIQKMNEFDKCYVLFSSDDDGECLFTYGLLRENMTVEQIKGFEEKFKQYLCDKKDDNSMVAFDVPDEEVNKVNEMLSKYWHI